MQKQKRIFSTILVLSLFLVLSGVIAHLLPSPLLQAEGSASLVDEEQEFETIAPPLLADNPYMIADIAEIASPATVFIAVEWPAPEPQSQREISPQDPFSFFFDYWFNEPFYNRQPSQQTSAGSGFIIDETGIILTNQHVVGNQGEDQTITIIVDAPGLEREYEAEIIGSDNTLDLAVLQIINEEEQIFPTIPLGDSDSSRIGEWTIAIGNPYGQDFEHTVTVGVLSAKGREITIMNQDSRQAQVYKNLMQTDAAINRGNSGGPLLNVKGEVIGINTAVHSQAQGIGFAIPINVVKEVLDELITTGGVHHPVEPQVWLGIHYKDIDDELTQQLRLPDQKGVLIVDIIQNSPAAESGLKPWDVLRRFGDRDVFSTEDIIEGIANYEPGDEVLITVMRQGEMLLLPVTLGDMPLQLRNN